MKHFARIGVLAATVAFAFCGCQSDTSSNGESGAAKKTAVEVVEAQKGEIKNEYTYSGKISASKEANISCLLSGQVDAVYFDIGDSVKAGDMLFKMENATYVNNLSAAEASLAGAELALKNSEKTYENNKVLLEAGAVSQSSFDQIELAYEQAKISVDSAKAQVASLQDTVDKSIVKTPISGVVTACNVKAGEVYSQSAGYAFSVIDMSNMTVSVSVSGSIINKISKGDTVSLKVSTVSNDMIEGTVKTVNPAANRAGTYDVEIEIPNEDGLIKAGMFAEVSFLSEKVEEVYAVPKDVVFEDEEGSYVFVAKDGIAVRKNVTTTVDDGENIAISDGIDDGDLIIVKGHNYIDNGAEVNVVNGEE